MKKRIILGLMLASTFALASCDLLSEGSTDTTSKTVDTGTKTDTKTTEDDNTKYTVTFDSKGGSTINSQEVKKGNKVPKPTDPTRDGYTFGGWYSDSYYINEYNFTKTVSKDLTLYAKWNEVPKTVLYEVGNSTVDLWTDSIGSKWMKIAIPVKNTGTADLYLGSATADIESSTGTLLDTESSITGFPQYIKPGETGYYYVATTRDFTETNVKVVPHVDVRKATKDVLRYDITDVSITEDTYYGVKVMGRAQNNTNKEGSLDKISAALFDSNNKLICVVFTYLDNNLAIGDKVGFSMTPFAYRDFTPEDVVRYEVYGHPTQLNL